MVKASSDKKLMRLHLNQWLGPVVYAYHPSYCGSINRMIMVQASLGIKRWLFSKITNIVIAQRLKW
jgi:hypothetical protein